MQTTYRVLCGIVAPLDQVQQDRDQGLPHATLVLQKLVLAPRLLVALQRVGLLSKERTAVSRGHVVA